MNCRYTGHSFVAVRHFKSEVYVENDDGKFKKVGEQGYNELVCRGCSGLVYEAVVSEWSPAEND